MQDGSTASVAVSHLRVTDELDVATAPQLRREVEAALRTRPQTLAVDLADCPFAGVDALEVLVDLTAEARRQGTTLVLLGLRPIVRQAIVLLGLESDLLYGQPPAPRPHQDGA